MKKTRSAAKKKSGKSLRKKETVRFSPFSPGMVLGMTAVAAVVAFVISWGIALQANGEVLSYQKISDTEGGFTATLDDTDNLGHAVSVIGDLNEDGVADIALGARGDDDGGANRGAVYILFMNTDGTVASYQKISDTEGGFTATLDDNDRFSAMAIAGIGDLNSDGVIDIAVGATGDDDGGVDRGALYILFMNTDGTVASYQKISDTDGGFGGTLDNQDLFGMSVANMGDVDGDGTIDLAVGVQNDDDGGLDLGAVYILFMNTDGTVDSEVKISDTTTGFVGALSGAGTGADQFGVSVANVGDLDGDGVNELAVGAYLEDAPAVNAGSAFIFFLNTDGTIDHYTNIYPTLDAGDFAGVAVTKVGDLDNNGVPDLAIGAQSDDDGGTNRGAIYVAMMNSDGTVSSYQKISDTAGNFTAPLDDTDFFGSALSGFGDLNGDGICDLLAGAHADDDGGNGRGSAYVLFLDGEATCGSSGSGGSGSGGSGGGGAPLPVPPSVPGSGTLQSSAVGSNSVTISWSPATDDTTPSDQLVYEVRYAVSSNDLSTVLAAETNGISAGAPQSGITSKIVSGLQPGTEYRFAVIVRDNDLTKSIYSQLTQSTEAVVDRVAPTLSDRVIKAVSVGETTIGLSWVEATDDVSQASQISYDIYKPTGNLPINTLPRVATNAALISTVTGVTSFELTGLQVNTEYPIVVVARDQAGNKVIYRAGVFSTRTAELVAHYGEFVRMNNGNQYFYIAEDGSEAYRVLSALVMQTWEPVSQIDSLERASIRQMPLGEEYVLPKPGTLILYASGVYYWIDGSSGNVARPTLRPFASEAVIASIFGAKWRTNFVIQVDAEQLSGLTMGEIVDQASDLTVNPSLLKTVKQYRADLKM